MACASDAAVPQAGGIRRISASSAGALLGLEPLNLTSSQHRHHGLNTQLTAACRCSRHHPPVVFTMSSSSAQRALDYLEQQPGTTFSKLYQQPSTALSIFRRMLPHLAKTIVMAMLYLPGGLLPAADVDVWVKPGWKSIQAKEQALSTLKRLRILLDEQTAEGPAYKLQSAFGRSLRQALTGGGQHRSFGIPCRTLDKHPVTVEYLDTFARRQWEAILYYVVGSANASLTGEVQIANGTRTLLEDATFVKSVGNSGRHRTITTEGFTFLLQDVNAQVWSLLIKYLEMAPSVCRESFAWDPRFCTDIWTVGYGPRRRFVIFIHTRLPGTRHLLQQFEPYTWPTPITSRPLRLWPRLSPLGRVRSLLPNEARHNAHLRSSGLDQL